MKNVNQYPSGTELLWKAFFYEPDSPEEGSCRGPMVKLDGPLEDAAKEAQQIALTNGWLLQCLARRY